MQGRPSWQDVRGRGFFLAVGIAFLGAMLGHGLYTLVTAKAPGETHCYGGVCHRVYSLEETVRMIGRPVDLVATHYDAPGVDKFNVGQYTSSGEEFDAENIARVSASNFPDGTELLLWHPTSRIATHVRVNDFGPFKGDRTIDVTRRNADVAGWAKRGVATLRVTVLWVPSPAEARYRRARVYPPSLGLIGVVEPHQLDSLTEMLIRTAEQRNSSPGARPLSVADVIAELPPMPAGYRSGGSETAEDETLRLASALAELASRLPALSLAEMPDFGAISVAAATIQPAAPASAEPVLDAATLIIASVSPPVLPHAVPAELTAPVSVAAAIAPPVDRPAPPSPTAPADPPMVVAEAVDNPLRETGPWSENQSTSEGTVRNPESGREQSSAAPSSMDRPAVASDASPIRPVPDGVTVATVRVAARSWFSFESPALWLGIGLMLSSLWGATAFSRQRRARAGLAPVRNDQALDSQMLEVARAAADRAEEDARAALQDEIARRTQPSAAEMQAREDLARELAARDADRVVEDDMRARLTAAAEEHERLQREFAAIEAAKAKRLADVQPPRSTVAAPAAVASPVAIAKPALRVQPPRSLADDAEMARFAGLTDRALVGAMLGLPGARYWGNVVIAQMRLDGTARSGSPMRIDGMVDGACYAPVVLVSEGAAVTGVVAAETVVVLGRISGTISARHVYVAASAQVEGDIYYESMSIDPQAHCDVSFSRLPGDSDPVALADAVSRARAA